MRLKATDLACGGRKMTDLIAKLRAALDEDERVAQGAAALCGCHGPKDEWSFADDDHCGRIEIADDPHSPIRRQLTRRWNRSYEDMRMAHHIARHDPARVLRQVAAMRKILELHEGSHECSVYGDTFESPRTDGEIDTCRWVSDEPCSTTLLLAEACGIEVQT